MSPIKNNRIFGAPSWSRLPWQVSQQRGELAICRVAQQAVRVFIARTKYSSVCKIISMVRDKIRDAFITCKCIKYNEMASYKTLQQYMANSIPLQGPDAQVPNVQQ
jgi:hypothetical protein